MVPLHHKHQESFENFESCVCVKFDALHLFRSTFITLPNSPKFVNPFLKDFFARSDITYAWKSRNLVLTGFRLGFDYAQGTAVVERSRRVEGFRNLEALP